MNTVVLLAGGTGKRMHFPIPKQHIEIEKHQIIEYTLSVFERSDEVDAILIVSNKDYIVNMEELKTKFSKLKWVIAGGATRILSTAKGVQFLQSYCSPDDYIVISDAARPCIRLKEIRECFEQLKEYSAVTTCIECYETIITTTGENVERIIKRDGLLRQTSPEAYRYSVLDCLYNRKPTNIIMTYDNIGIDQMIAMGQKIGIVKTSSLNFKITTWEDIALFEGVLKNDYERFYL